MSPREERQLAVRLARVLDGHEQAADEVAALATVLEQATEAARFDVSEEETEQALALARPRLRVVPAPTRRRPPRLAWAMAAAAVAAAAVLVITLVQLPSLDIEGKALAALGGKSTVLEIQERIEPAVPGTFPVSTRTVWLDSALGLERSIQRSRARTVEEILAEPGRITRYLPEENLAIVAQSCRNFASGCAELVDPVEFYRHTLQAPGTVKTKREGAVYRLTLPLQTLPDAVRIEQEVTIDAKTFLPKEIDWSEQPPGGRLRPVSRILVDSITRYARENAPVNFSLVLPSNVRIEQRFASKVPLRKIGERRLTLAAARRLRPPLLWLGPEHFYRRLTAIDEVRWSRGTVYRVRYESFTVWNYSNVVPPELLSSRLTAPAKTIPVGGNVAHYYQALNGAIVAELDLPGRTVAIEAPTFVKEDLIAALSQLRPLR